MRRLLVVCETQAHMNNWVRHVLGGHARDPRFMAFTPYMRTVRARGLSETHTAIVHLGRNTLPEGHRDILHMYNALGMKVFDAEDVLEIKAWLFDGDDRVTVLMLPFLHDAVELLVKIIKVCVTCAAIEQRVVSWIETRAPHCADVRRHALEDMVYELQAGYHRKP